ncbi:MAG: hypothetical protein EBV23_05105 [Flavobacteriia bacterium]|nr:hypothetical protein [Flavobacteriia bacterium]
MNSLSQRERIVLSFILSLAFFVFLFMALQIAYYERYIPVEPFFKPEVATMDDPLELSPQDLSIQSNSNELKNLSRDMNDSRQASNTQFSENRASGDPNERIRQFEQQLFDEAGGQKEREKILKEHQQNQQKNPDPNVANSTKGEKSNGDNKQFKGDVMVDWKLDGRTAYENNNWWVRNPGYTCGYGSSGKVVVNITVDQSGKVVQAIYDANASSGASQCMIEQSVAYAKKSKFNYKEASGQQSGFIVYRFVSQ